MRVEVPLITTTFKLTIGREHIDEYGHVNYKAAPSLFEAAQDDFLTKCHPEMGLSFKYFEETFGLRSFVKKTDITWHDQLKEGDDCNISTSLELGKTSMKFYQSLEKADGLTISFFMVVVLVDSSGTPTPIPEDLRKLLVEVNS